MNSIWKNKLYTFLSIVFLLILWKGLSIFIGWEIILPSPEDTLRSLINIMKSNDFFGSVFNTVVRSLIGFGLALGLAIVLGILSGIFKPLYYIFNPLISIIKATPTIAIILLALIWLGSNRTPILVGFLIIFPILYTNILEGIHNVDDDLVEMAKMYRVRDLRIIKELYFPAILSYLMAGVSTALGLNLKVVIAAEVLSQSMTTMGEGMYMEKIVLNTAGVFSWTIVAIIIAAAFEYSLKSLQGRIEKWK